MFIVTFITTIHCNIHYTIHFTLHADVQCRILLQYSSSGVKGQMDQKTCRRWQLQDVLHAVGEQGITQSDYGDEDGDGTQARIEPKEPKLRGLLTALDLEAKSGLPECISANEQMYIFRAIAAGMRTPRGGRVYTTMGPPHYMLHPNAEVPGRQTGTRKRRQTISDSHLSLPAVLCKKAFSGQR